MIILTATEGKKKENEKKKTKRKKENKVMKKAC